MNNALLSSASLVSGVSLLAREAIGLLTFNIMWAKCKELLKREQSTSKTPKGKLLVQIIVSNAVVVSPRHEELTFRQRSRGENEKKHPGRINPV